MILGRINCFIFSVYDEAFSDLATENVFGDTLMEEFNLHKYLSFL
jgi:hypothetical protein